VILIDELVAYVRQFEEGKALTGGTFDSNLSFVQALTEALKAVPTAVLLASLPESDKEAGSQRGVKALEALAHYFGRVQALWKPVATEEAFEIVRRRLFASINDKLAMESVCRAFADFYTANRDDFPHETQESRYFDRLMHAYPIHPEVFDRLYEDWSSLDNFQRTRGVLKMMAKVIHRLWKDNNNDPLIMPGSLPLYDADVRNEVIYYLPQGWDPVLERDVDGERAETTEIENKDTRLGSVQACRRAARRFSWAARPARRTRWCAAGAGARDARHRAARPADRAVQGRTAPAGDRLHYLNTATTASGSTRGPTCAARWKSASAASRTRRMCSRRPRPRAARLCQRRVRRHPRLHDSGDVPDDWALRLVVLPPDAAFSRAARAWPSTAPPRS
jgi:hypothetical protein